MSASAANQTIRVGIVGLGGNARLRHVGGLRACENVEIHAVCNRRRESTEAAAREFDIPKTYDHWQDLIADPELDAILIGAWPYLHCPVTLAALEASKHVLTEARMGVFAQVQAFVPERFDPATGMLRGVGAPDSVHALAVLEKGAHAIYHVSGVARFGTGTHLQLYGSEGTIKYELAPQDLLWAARRGDGELREVDVPADEALEWRVEAEFIAAIRGEGRIEFTDIAAGLGYMEFTEAVARSAVAGRPINLPLDRD